MASTEDLSFAFLESHPTDAARVLERVAPQNVAALLSDAPVRLVAFRLLLGYPEDTVGAWMDPRVLALPADTTAETEIRRLREAEGENAASIFVIGPEQRVLGQADLPDVLRTRRIRAGSGYGDLVGSVASDYWLGVARLIQLVVALLPVTPPQSNGESHER